MPQTVYEPIIWFPENSLCWICSNFDFHNPIRSQFCTCHDSGAVVACAKLWPDQMIAFHLMEEQQDLDHEFVKHFGKWCQRPFKQQSCTLAAHGYSLYALILCMSFKLNPLTHKNLGCNEHCGCWCPGAKAPGHQYPQCWPYTYHIGPVSDKNKFTMNNIHDIGK